MIKVSLLNATLKNIKTEEGDEFPLIDFLSVGDTIKEGREEIEYIVEQIFFDMDEWTFQ